MSANMNILILAGNLTRAPELRYTPGGSPVTSFSIATNRKWKDAQGRLNDEATFVDCECWGTTAENVSQYLGKGSSVIIRGRLRLDRWTDKQTNKPRSKLKCVAEVVQFIASGRRQRQESDDMVDELPPDGDEAVPAGQYDDDVPF